MAEDKQNFDTLSVHDQIEQLKQQLEDITVNHLHLKAKVEQIETDLLHEIKQREEGLKQGETSQQSVQVIPSLDKNREISAYAEENRTFIQSIWKRRK